MFIVDFASGPLATIAYLVGDENSGRAIVIDAPKDCASRIASVTAEMRVAVGKIILTHTHWDHTADAAELRRIFGAPVCVHRYDERRMLAPESEIYPPPFPLAALAADQYLTDDETIEAGGVAFRVLFTPGHTEGSVCLFDFQHKIVFSGDTLFAGSVGRTDLPGGSRALLMESIRNKLLTLPEDVVVYPGHGPATTIGNERIFNPFLNGEIE